MSKLQPPKDLQNRYNQLLLLADKAAQHLDTNGPVTKAFVDLLALKTYLECVGEDIKQAKANESR